MVRAARAAPIIWDQPAVLWGKPAVASKLPGSFVNLCLLDSAFRVELRDVAEFVLPRSH